MSLPPTFHHFILESDKEGYATQLFTEHSYGLLICTLIYENQGLEKSRSASNLNIFLGLHLEKKARFIPDVTWHTRLAIP